MSGELLILGKNGQLGYALAALCGEEAVALGRDRIDLADPGFTSKLEPYLRQPVRAVINTAAYTQVDRAEDEGRAEAFRVNAQAVGELAALCQLHNLPLVHFSTDYVFDGSGDAPWTETDQASPLNEYGKSKLAGEQAIVEACEKYLIFRTSWVYDAMARNFFTTMLRLFTEKETMNVINDQFGAPTYASHLAQAALLGLKEALALAAFPSGIYHLCAGGETSWYGFAQAIFALARSGECGQDSPVKCQQIQPIPASEYPLPAKRPHNSRLDCAKAARLLGVAMPHWRAGLEECVKVGHGSRRLPVSGIKNHPAEIAGG